MDKQRERFSSRLGFILISAGCAIGLGNVWRFPYITGQYGGAAFVLVYLLFLVILGMPIMIMEFSVGRASQKSAAKSFHVLEPKGTKWHLTGYAAMAGNYLLMMFYTTVGGWMLAYVMKMLTGEFVGLTPDEVGGVFDNMLAQPTYMTAWMIVTVLIGFFCLQFRFAKRRRAHHQSNDELLIYHFAGVMYPQHHSARCRRGHNLLFNSRFSPHGRGRTGRGNLCRDGAGILHFKLGYRRDVDFRQLYQQRPLINRRNFEYLRFGYHGSFVGRLGNYPSLLCFWDRCRTRTGISICHSAQYF